MANETSGGLPRWRSFLNPGPLLGLGVAGILFAALSAPGDWVLAVVRVWLCATILVPLGVLLAAPLLPPLRERSHLIGRLQTLAKFLWAAALLCISSFVGALVGAQIQSDSAGLHIGHTVSLLKTVFLLAIAIGGLWFGGGAALDIWRLGPDGRLGAVSRAVKFVARPWTPPAFGLTATKWVHALTSPFWLTAALSAGTIFVVHSVLGLAGVRIG